MTGTRKTYPLEIAGLLRQLPIIEVQPGLRIALLNILGDTELVQACAVKLAEKLSSFQYDILVTAEAKSIPVTHALSVETNKPYVVLRKTYRLYMGETIHAETLSITTGKTQTLYLDEKDRVLMRNKNVILVDDVISTGSTLKGMRSVVEKAGGHVIAEASILVEGDRERWDRIISLGHIPLFTD